MSRKETEARETDFKMELISKGMFLDQSLRPGPKYAVTVYTYRLNWHAANVWLDTMCPADREPEQMNAIRENAERLTRKYLGVAPDAVGWHFQPMNRINDVLTVIHVEKVPDILPYFGETLRQKGSEDCG